MDDIKQRLSSATEECLKKYEAWEKAKKNAAAREDLQDAVHELRKVSSRIEIDIAVSERAEVSSKPIPIPAHRANKTRSDDSGDDNGFGNGAEDSNNGPKVEKVQKPRRRKPRTAESP